MQWKKIQWIDDKVLTGVFAILFVLNEARPDLNLKEIGINAIFCLNYVLLVGVINYYFLPKFFYEDKIGLFILFSFAAMGVAGFIEEGVVEKIFYPNTRGTGSVNLDDIAHAFFGFLPLVTVMFTFKLAWDYRDKQRKTEELAKENLENELKFLKSQINPHVLFNNLNNIYAFSMEQSPRAPQMILKLANIMRYMLYECEEAYVPLSKELKYLESYIQLYELQLEGRGKVKFKQVGSPEGYHVAPLLLVAFVENCFKHSMATQLKDILIQVQVRIFDGLLDFTAENNYGTYTQEEDPVEGGIGLKNVKKRLTLLYPGKHSLKIQQTKENFWVNLRIQLV